VVELGAISVPALSLNLATSSNLFISGGPVGQIGGEESGDMLVVACMRDASVACKTGYWDAIIHRTALHHPASQNEE